jgi:hypothetical protein
MLCQREGKSENLELEITLSLCSIRSFQDRLPAMELVNGE